MEVNSSQKPTVTRRKAAHGSCDERKQFIVLVFTIKIVREVGNREAVKPLSLEIFENELDMALRNLD